MRTLSSMAVLALAAWTLFLPGEVSAAGRTGDEVMKLKVREVRVPAPKDDAAYLAKPVVLKFYDGRLYVADFADHAVKIYSADGAFLGAIGRRGSGPGEFDQPTGMDVFGGRLYVGDQSCSRIQVFDLSGRLVDSFSTAESRFGLKVLAADRILLHTPLSGLDPEEKLLAFVDARGKVTGSLLAPGGSGRPQYGFIYNKLNVVPDGTGGFFVVFAAEHREILRFDGRGGGPVSVPVDERYPRPSFRGVVDGGKRTIEALCWACGYSDGCLYLTLPEIDGDILPGRRVFLLDDKGRLKGEIELPVRVTKIEPAGGRIYAVDVDHDLRIFEVMK